MARHVDIELSDAAEAALVVSAFWAALAADDDLGLVALCAANTFEHFGHGPGLAGRMRSAFEVTRVQCQHVGCTDRVRVLRGGTLAFSCLPSSGFGEMRALGLHGPESIPGWRIAVCREAGRWRVSGTVPDPLDVVEYLELPPAASESGQVN